MDQWLKWGVSYHFVMFFTIQIVILIIFTLDSFSSLAIRDKIKTKEYSYSTKIQRKWKIEEYTPKDEKSFTTHVPLFEIIKNLTKTKSPNLKSNVFDKMLSDEMLSIKQHFFEQDIKSSTIAILSKSNVPTPTLEVKQKWPIGKFISKFNHSKDSNYNESLNSEKFKNDTKPEENNKVLGLRSLPEVIPHFANPIYLYKGSKICTCMKNPSTGVTCTHQICPGGRSICTQSADVCKRGSTSLNMHSIMLPDQTSSHSCTQDNSRTCTHGNLVSSTHGNSHSCTQGSSQICTQCSSHLCTQGRSSLCTHKECTRGETLYSTAYYVTYQPFFIGITQPSNALYYHPEVLNELKLPRKFKHRKTTKTNIKDNLYYNNEKEVVKDESYEDDSDNSEEDYIYADKTTNQNQHEILEFHTNKYEEKVYGTKTEKCSLNKHIGKSKGKKIILKDKTVNNLLNDLKVYYGDSVIKDCYCSLMSPSSYVHSFRFYKFLLAFIIIVYNHT